MFPIPRGARAAACAPLLAIATVLAAPVSAFAHARGASAGLRIDEFAGWVHDAGNVLLHLSNRGYFGRGGADLTNPSCEWPAGSNEEYLFSAGLWIGGVVHRGGAPDTTCSAGTFANSLFLSEFANREPDEGCGVPPVGICEGFEGGPGGLRRVDDDGDGRVDEDPLDGADNDDDGRIDEDYAGISQQMFRCVYYDTSTMFNQLFPDEADHHRPLGLRVEQESYQWTDPNFDDFVGVEFRITNISRTIDPLGWDISSCYIGFMVDGDVGIDDQDLNPHEDDQGAFAQLDTTVVLSTGAVRNLGLTMGYIFDEHGGTNAADDVPGFCGVMFLGHTVDTLSPDLESALAPRQVGIHAFRIWSGGDQDARDDLDRYRFLRGLQDTGRTIDQPTTRPNDYRFLVSAGPFASIPPDSTLTFQVAFVLGNMVSAQDPNSGLTRRIPDFTNPMQAQLVYDGDQDLDLRWATSSPPPPPNITVTPGDRSVTIDWDDFPEEVPDPLTGSLDFAGYQVWKAEGWRRESTIPAAGMWRLVADVDTTELSDVDTGMSGIGRYRWVDTRVQNGFTYWYAVTSYDQGVYRIEVDGADTTFIRTEAPKFGKYSQNMTAVMPRTTPAQTLDDVYVVPNPYRATAAWDLAETDAEPTGRRIKFFNLPARATIRIFSLAGDHVATIEHDAARTTDENGQTSWNLISRNNQDTVSGIYIYHVRAEDGAETTGKFVVIR